VQKAHFFTILHTPVLWFFLGISTILQFLPRLRGVHFSDLQMRALLPKPNSSAKQL
jgi:hypothetical protein